MTILPAIAVMVITVASILVLILTYRLHNFMAELDQPVHYLKSSTANTEPWRWRKPNLEVKIHYQTDGRLSIQDAPDVSRLMFPQRISIGEVTAHFFGLVAMGFALLVLWGYLLQGLITHFLSFVTNFLFWFGLGVMLLQAGDRVLQIDLHPDSLEIVTLHSFALRRKIIHAYKRHQLLKVSGKVQSFWTMERTQGPPDYKITLRRLMFDRFPVNQTFSLTCNQTQGSWVVGGLNHWKSLSI
jgi:hypothetical protein